MPGVGYVEMAFAASSSRALTAVAFLRPCSLSGPGRGEKCVLRCTRRAGALEIASARGTNSSSFATCFAGTLATIESGCAESMLEQGLSARMERSIKAASRRHNPAVSQAIIGPRPRLLEVSCRIGGTAWTFSARKSLSCASRHLRHSTNLANALSNDRECTKLRLARLQSCKSTSGTVLSSSRVPSSQAWDGK